ncbi:MAG: kinase, partial [Pseudomonadales bacterium]
WLVGKTGAGKSSVIQKLTGYDEVEVGNGFRPCTQTAAVFDYPQQQAILRFLDTKGLGEVGYDPAEDLKLLGKQSHALIVLARVSDNEQSQITQALRAIRKSARHIKPESVLIVHSCLHQVPNDSDRQRAIQSNQQSFEQAWGKPLDYCEIDFTDPADGLAPHDRGIDELRAALADKLPSVQLWLHQQRHDDAESKNFERLQPQVLWYAGTAGLSDAIPLAGLVTVPATQGKMLHSLAQQYDLQWDRRSITEFIGVLGTGFAISYLGSLGGRQLAKLVPALGQTVGSATAATVSFVSTYAIGRAACVYLYKRSVGESIDKTDIQAKYKAALKEGGEARKAVLKNGPLKNKLAKNDSKKDAATESNSVVENPNE